MWPLNFSRIANLIRLEIKEINDDFNKYLEDTNSQSQANETYPEETNTDVVTDTDSGLGELSIRRKRTYDEIESSFEMPVLDETFVRTMCNSTVKTALVIQHDLPLKKRKIRCESFQFQSMCCALLC